MRRLPQFPLQLVVYPREQVNLHVFEERYKVLINEVQKRSRTFGITPFINGRVADFGTEVELVKVVKKYEDGQLDISCRGLRIFRIDQFHSVHPKDGYSYADVSFMESNETSSVEIRRHTLALLKQLTGALGNQYTFKLNQEDLHSSQFVHKLGFDIEKELELVCMLDEEERLKSINQHLRAFIPGLEKADEIRRRIQQNGHFKRLDPLDL